MAGRAPGRNVGWKLHFEPINNNPETLEAIQSHLSDIAQVSFKGGSSGYGNLASEGKTYTAYPRSLEERDRVMASMLHEDTGISHLLAPVTPVEGNAQFTDKITGRFATGYTYADPSTGEIDWGRHEQFGAENFTSVAASRRGEVNNYIKHSWNSPYERSLLDNTPLTETQKKGFRVSHEEVAEDIELLRTNHPAVHELMVGKPGYKSPYPLHLPGVDSAPVRPTVGIPPATTAPAPPAPTTATPPPNSAPRSRTREEVKNTVVDSLLKDENHPDPAKAEFNKRWNEQVRKDSASTGNKANPFEEKSGRVIEDEMYSEVTSNKGDALAAKIVEDKQQDVQDSVQEKGAETVKDKLLEKGEEKLQEIAKDKVKEVIKEKTNVGGTKAEKSGVRVRKTSTTRFYRPNCPNCPNCCSQGYHSSTAGSQCCWSWSATGWSKHCRKSH